MYAFTLPLAQMSENGNVSMNIWLIISLLEFSLWPNCSIIIFSLRVWHFVGATDKAVCACVDVRVYCTH